MMYYDNDRDTHYLYGNPMECYENLKKFMGFKKTAWEYKPMRRSVV